MKLTRKILLISPMLLFLGLALCCHIQFQQYARVNTIEWGRDGNDFILVFSETDLNQLRMVLIHHSPFGQQMQDAYIEYLRQSIPALKVVRRDGYTLISPRQQSLSNMMWLDYYGLLSLKLRKISLGNSDKGF